MKLEDMAWPEVKEYLQNKQALIIPVGTCEQHGPHLPLNSDTLVAEAIAFDVSRATGFLIAPSFTYGVNLPCDKEFSGTNSLTEEILRNYARSLLGWWKQQGFKKFYALSGHGDPMHIKALQEADPDYLTVIELYEVDIEDILEKQKWVRHADEGETSVLMHLYPNKVRRDKIVDFDTPFDVFKPYLFHEKTDPIEGSPGPQGYPSAASPEKGKAIYERMQDRATSLIKG